jgi:flagellar hook-length control protein FliK
MMNLMLNTVNPAPAAVPAAAPSVAPAAVPAADSAPAEAVPAAAAAAPALPFAQWMGQQADLVLAPAAATAPDDGAAPATLADAPAQDEADGAAAAPVAASPLLAAMAMPLLAVALPIAAAQQLAPSGDGTSGQRATPVITAAAPSASAAASPTAGTGASAGANASMRIDAPDVLAAAPLQAPALDNDTGAAAVPPAPAPAPALHASAGEGAPPAAAPARPALAPNAGSPAPDASSAPAAPQQGAAPWGVSAPAAPQQGAPAATVALAGPPAAWRQTLHEALGERLHLQLGNNMEQAVIRLEPPMLGRVEIAIRHSAGALEVTLSATHGEVLRQLQTVSDNLRNDLAQRQFTEVAVNVTPAPRGAAANPFGADPQGRGRQDRPQQEDNTPGLALNDAASPSSTFSLNGRA